MGSHYPGLHSLLDSVSSLDDLVLPGDDGVEAGDHVHEVSVWHLTRADHWAQTSATEEKHELD